MFLTTCCGPLFLALLDFRYREIAGREEGNSDTDAEWPESFGDTVLDLLGIEFRYQVHVSLLSFARIVSVISVAVICRAATVYGAALASRKARTARSSLVPAPVRVLVPVLA
ncbi:MAG: hypothetical protein JWN49_486 [Parcubacteria group bacterium]|nr:hypothetical protein [Parcubacteria group bacterium]